MPILHHHTVSFTFPGTSFALCRSWGRPSPFEFAMTYAESSAIMIALLMTDFRFQPQVLNTAIGIGIALVVTFAFVLPWAGVYPGPDLEEAFAANVYSYSRSILSAPKPSRSILGSPALLGLGVRGE